MAKKASSNGPVKRFRLGAVSAAVFEQKGEGGTPFHSVVLQRSFRDDKGEWQHTNSFSLSHLPAAIKALELAFDFVADQEASDNPD